MVRSRIPTDMLKLLLDSNGIALIKVEARNAIVGSIDLPYYGIFGTCYSQPKDFVDKLLDQTSAKFYNTNTAYHELGQCTVDIVLSALNALPNIKAWQTPDNSVVDVCWKWDLVIEHNRCLYPAQIKTSLDAIKKCKEKFADNLTDVIDKFDNQEEKIIDRCDKAIDGYMKKYSLTSVKAAKIVELIREKDEKIKRLRNSLENYKKAEPVYIWASHNEETIKDLTNTFAELFSVQDDINIFQDKAVKDYKSRYQTVKETLVDEEKEKIKCIKQIIYCLQDYCKIKLEVLNQKYQINHSIAYRVQLEDILSHKIATNSLKILESALNYSELFIEKAITFFYENNYFETRNKTELTKRKARKKIDRDIRQEIQSNNILRASRIRRQKRLESYNDKKVNEKELIQTQTLRSYNLPELLIKLEKLTYFDSSNSFNKLIYCRKLTEKIILLNSEEKVQEIMNNDDKPE